MCLYFVCTSAIVAQVVFIQEGRVLLLVKSRWIFMSSFYLQGYFQTLFTCIEKLLGFLNVKNLVLPAAEEVGSIWKNKFGFGAITQDEVCVFVRSIHSSVALMMLLIYFADKRLWCCVAADGIQEKVSDNGVSRGINAAKASPQVPNCR